MWWTRRALLLHATVGLLLPGFGALAWWQTTRALDGNTLSWMYVFEWPFFAAYAVFMWWKIVHEQDTSSPGETTPSHQPGDEPAGGAERPEDPGGAEADRELAEYNRYLAALHAADNDGRSRRARR